MTITEFITLVKYVVLKIQLSTIKLRDKIIARPKLYQENTKNVRKSHSQQIEELNNKVEELTRTREMLISKN